MIRPNRRARRLRGKSDAADAGTAALAALNGKASGAPKSHDGEVESIRMLRVARRGAIKARTQTAATLLATAGDNPGRLRTEASFAALCGASPVDASSGKQIRHRLNHGGDRQANSALWRIVVVRMSHDPRTKALVTGGRQAMEIAAGPAAA